jgi:RNA polymerase sigma-70 factor (ECF subfamily)
LKQLDAATDEELMGRYAAGEAEAFDQLLERHKRAVYGTLLRSVPTRTEAEDLLQEVFVKVIRAAPRWQPRARFTTWLYTLVRNTAIDAARRRRTRGHELPLAEPNQDNPAGAARELRDHRPSPLAQAIGGELQQALEAAIAGLPETQREALLLKRQGLRFDQIAEITGVPTGTAKSRLRYALEGVRRALAARGLKVPA